jgi:hypothetical protein
MNSLQHSAYSWAVREKIVRVLYRCPPLFVSASSVKGNCKLFGFVWSCPWSYFSSTRKLRHSKDLIQSTTFFLLFYYLFTFLLMSVLPIGRVASTRISYMLFRLIWLANICFRYVLPRDLISFPSFIIHLFLIITLPTLGTNVMHFLFEMN